MNILVIIAFMFFVTFSYLNLNKQIDEDSLANSSTSLSGSQSVVSNMFTYNQAARSYYLNNPTATGVIADASLTGLLPVGFTKGYNWTSNINGGYVYTYTSDIAATKLIGLADTINRQSGGSLMAGINNGGVIYSASNGNTGITLPAFVPNGSPILMGK